MFLLIRNVEFVISDLLEDEAPSKRKSTEKAVKVKSDKPSEKTINYIPSKIKDRKTSDDSVSEKKVDKETNTVIKKRITHDEISVKKSVSVEPVKSSREETSSKKEDLKKRQKSRSPGRSSRSPGRSSRSPGREKSSDKMMYDARELLNRKKAEKLACKDVPKQNEQVKRKRDHSPHDRSSLKRTVSRVNDLDSLNRRVTVVKDSDLDRNGREKDSGLKSTIHRTALKRKSGDGDKIDERSERYKDDKPSDSSRSSKVIRISETLQEEHELIKPRTSSKTVVCYFVFLIISN